MEQFLLLFGFLIFLWSFLSPQKPKGLSGDDRSMLEAFLERPDEVLSNYEKSQKLLKIAQRCSRKEITEFYNKLRYKTGRWKDEFGEVKIAPLFEDIAYLYYQKQHKEADKAQITQRIREDFKFLCRSR
ncbi:hypothetical protein [Baaleninema simplex]|uniref:hypothetical protein n=1 Tax=Baaleninema simplex TaxID=2862350 RepID=UPI000345573C|nr:hypothetical protein [Baaleninema simplex]